MTELPFYKGLNKIKADHAFKGYAQTFRVEIVDRKNPICQSNANKLAIKALFSDLLNETKGFRYQVTMKVLLKKYKISEIEFAPAYFNSTVKTVINYKTGLEDSFQEILYRIGNWINKGSGWITESIDAQYINISTYRPLLEVKLLQLPVKLRNAKKD